MKVKLLGALRLFSVGRDPKAMRDSSVIPLQTFNLSISFINHCIRCIFYEISSIVFIKEMSSWELNTKPTCCDTQLFINNNF